ncbi:MAG: hypothetical protein M1822_004410 [Bathelium mastoideum]|nr:MAG: hypothetical protein M1822_004410 [Bathelium mastoideum]
MATAPRLTFLCPALFRTRPSPSSAARHAYREFYRQPRSGYRATYRKQQDEVRSRYGTANEPPPHLSTSNQPAQKNAPQKPQSSKPEASVSSTPEKAVPPKAQDKAATEKKKGKDVDSSPDPPKAPDKPKETAPQEDPLPGEAGFGPAASPDTPHTPHTEQPSTAIKPLETVLHMEPPSTLRDEQQPSQQQPHKPPHLVTPPYVHHFDTYTLVRNLEEGGFSQEQAVTCMKAVRSLLALNMELAREGLVSKSDVENETYLFKAACSELRAEIQNKRRREVEQMRTERAQLQHEFDILSQRVGQDSGGLKDELKGMFDDRKMGVRMEQRAMESTIRDGMVWREEAMLMGTVHLQIQQLNHKITVALNSDSRSEVEGLRWILTRRAGMTIAISAVMILAGASYISRLEAEERERKKKKKDEAKEKKAGRDSGDGGASPQTASDGTDDPVDALANLSTKEGMSPGYVSLG